MINGNQCTIKFHLNNLQLIHIHQKELNKIINQLNDVFESDKELLTASYRKIHQYFGMTIDWNLDWTIMFTTYEYLEDILIEASAVFDG